MANLLYSCGLDCGLDNWLLPMVSLFVVVYLWFKGLKVVWLTRVFIKVSIVVFSLLGNAASLYESFAYFIGLFAISGFSVCRRSVGTHLHEVNSRAVFSGYHGLNIVLKPVSSFPVECYGSVHGSSYYGRVYYVKCLNFVIINVSHFTSSKGLVLWPWTLIQATHIRFLSRHIIYESL